MRDTQPELHTNVTPAEPEGIQAWHTDDPSRAIVADNDIVRLLAIATTAGVISVRETGFEAELL